MAKSKSAIRRDLASQDHSSQQPPSQWSQLADHLQGLLSVHIDEPFVDLEHLCPQSAWLVLNLDLIRPITNIRHALDALAVLCVRSERIRLDEKLHEAYWRQMLTSDMMREAPSPNAPVIAKFARFVRHKNVRVMLSWRGKRFQSVVANQLRTFLDASIDQYAAVADSLDSHDDGRGWRVWRTLGVGIRFEDVSLTREDVRAIKQMLRQPTAVTATSGITTTTGLCEQHTLRKLDLSGNRFAANALRELASLLEDPQCRRVDDLDLQRTVPPDAIERTDDNYVSAFKRLAVAILTAKPKPQSKTYVRADAGVALSLAHNTMYDGLHLEALHNALETASRPLSALSLAYTKHEQSAGSAGSSHSTPSSSSSPGQKWLARICMTSPHTSFTEDALLDLTLANIDLDMDKFHGELTDVIVPRLQDALAAQETMVCRVHEMDAYEKPDYHAGQRLDSSVTYPVLEVCPDGWCRILDESLYDSDEEDEEDEGDEGDPEDGEEEEEEEEEEENEEDDNGEEDEEDEEEGEDGDEDAEDGETSPEDPLLRYSWWVKSTQICDLYAASAPSNPILRMRFTQVVFDGNNDEYSTVMAPKSTFLERFLALTGRQIKRISLRRWHDIVRTLRDVIPSLPNIRELDLQGSNLKQSLWTLRSFNGVACKTLAVMNVSGANIGNNFFSELLEEIEGGRLDEAEDEDDDVNVQPLQFNLRYLSMLDCPLNVTQVGRLRDLLQTNKSLELVEMAAKVLPSGAGDEPTPSKMAHFLSLGHDHERLDTMSSLSVDRTVAFACALPKISHFRNADIDSVILARCLEYAGHVSTRRIVWCDSVAVRKWYRPHITAHTTADGGYCLAQVSIDSARLVGLI